MRLIVAIPFTTKEKQRMSNQIDDQDRSSIEKKSGPEMARPERPGGIGGKSKSDARYWMGEG
ncbi:MAG TPA: hypothetical protein VIM57_08525, partial [Luteolibacter sp.]